MEKKKKIVLAGLALVAVIALSFFIFGKEKPKSESSACRDLKSQVSEEIAKMNYCQTQNDCVLVNGCPHGCNNLVNKDADWGKLSELSFSYTDTCGECTEQCLGALRSENIACVDGKCVAVN